MGPLLLFQLFRHSTSLVQGYGLGRTQAKNETIASVTPFTFYNAGLEFQLFPGPAECLPEVSGRIR